MKTKDWVIVGLLGLALAQGVGNWLRSPALRKEQLAAANARAAADTSRHRVEGQLAIATRLAFQRSVELAAAVREKGKVGQSAVRLRLEGDSLRRELAGRVLPTTDTAAHQVVAVGELDARDTLGIRAAARVTVSDVTPGPRPLALFAWTLERAPAPLEVSLSCQGRDAVADVTGPRWLPITIDQAVQSPEVCNPPPRWEPFSVRLPSVPVALVLIGAGMWIQTRIQ